MKLYRFDPDYDNKPWLREFEVVKETTCGYWIEVLYREKDRWISKITRKKYAYPTKEEALIGYIKRKEKYIWHLERKLKDAKEALANTKGIDLSIKLLTFDGGF